jgi:hypothetical protein
MWDGRSIDGEAGTGHVRASDGWLCDCMSTDLATGGGQLSSRRLRNVRIAVGYWIIVGCRLDTEDRHSIGNGGQDVVGKVAGT